VLLVLKQVESVLVVLLDSIIHLIVNLVLQIVQLAVFAMLLLVNALHVLMDSLERDVKYIVRLNALLAINSLVNV
jgi:hypothetical protein